MVKFANCIQLKYRLQMINLTFLSLDVISSFQKSPFIHLSSFTYLSFSVYKSINAQKFFSSFLITQSFNSFSKIEGSIFKQFIISFPILSFQSNQFEAIISDQNFYGDTIPSSNNIFYNANYTEIVNCKFMSITDDENEQIESEGGLCIYSTKNTAIDSCYFFAIYSLRSGSAIFFEEKDNHINATVVNCMFKSISQAIYLHDNNYFSGGAISYGYFRINNDYDNTMPQYISSSKTNNCYFDNVRLIGYIYAAAQFGIVSYFSHYIESKNLNFSACCMIGYSQQMGFLCFFWADYSINSFSFINFFDCSCKEYGSFSVEIENDIHNQVFSLSFANFINNSNQNDEYQAQFTVFESISVRTYLKLSNIQCNSKETFIIYGYSLYEENHSTIDIIVSDSLFGCSADSFIFRLF